MAGERHVHSGRIAYLDGWRGLSLLLVLVGHFGPEVRFNLATFGVELFFVLSGRLMADILFVERYPLPEFFRRRISRIFPGMAVFVLLVFVAARGTPYGFKPFAAVSALTFTLNYAMVFQHGVAAIENLWSLCIEEHAYVLLGGLALIARRSRLNPLWVIAGLCLLSLADAAVSTLVFGQGYREVYWRTDAHLSSIFLGGIAYLLLRGRQAPAWTPLAAFAIGVAFSCGPDILRYSLGTACIAVALATLDRAPAALHRTLSWKPLIGAGLWSYSIYLWQQPFYRLALDRILPVWAAAGVAVLLGLASFYFVEQPARRFLNARWRGAKARRASPPSPAMADPVQK